MIFLFLFRLLPSRRGLLQRLKNCELWQDRSPSDNLINDSSLLGACTAKIDARRLYAFVPHEVGKTRYIVEPLQKVLGETMPKRVRINHRWVQFIFDSQFFQLCGNPSRRNAFSTSVYKDEARSLITRSEPHQCLTLEFLWNIDATNFSAFWINVNVSCCNVFNLDL